MKKFFKILLKTILIIIVVIGSLLLVSNLLKLVIYSDYYAAETEVCTNPGLNDGFVPQGIAVVDDNTILTSGYMDDKTPSRIYIIDVETNTARYLNVYVNGKASTGHFGGIAYSNGMVYLANGSKIQVISLTDLLNCVDKVEFEEGIKMMHKVSYCFADDKYLYVGEFHDEPNYICEHEIKTTTGTNYALCTAYSLDDLTTPVKTYSIPNRVQGFAINDEGTIVLSVSGGINNSKYLVYEKDNQQEVVGTYLDLSLTILDIPCKVIEGPAMAEDLSVYNNKFYCLTESACNKYVFGKFFFANNIYYLDINK